MSPSTTPAPRRLADALLALGLLALVLKMSYDVARVRDIGLGIFDEASYMQYAAHIPDRGLPPAEYAPLYCLWYRALSAVFHDPVHLYYANWQALTALLALGAYALCRAAGGGRAVGLAAGFLVPASALADVWPYPSYLACIVLAFGAAAAAQLRAPRWSLAALAVTALAGAYARPELGASFLVLCGVAAAAAAWAALRRPWLAWRWAAPAAAVTACCALLYWTMGNPMGGGRSFVAFSQHYAMNVVAANKLPPASVLHYESITAKDFGQAATVGEAWRANPRALLWHVGYNVRRLPEALGQLMEPRLDLGRDGQRFLIAALAAAAALGAAGAGRRLLGRATPDGVRRGAVALMAAALLIPAAPAALLIAPRLHYLMPSALFLIALAGGGLCTLPRLRRVWAWLERPQALLALFALLAALTPNRAHGWDVQSMLRGRPAAPPAPLVEQSVVAGLRRLQLHRPTHILDYADRAFLAGLPADVVPLTSKDGPFLQFVRKSDIGVMVLDQVATGDPLYRDDPEFVRFLSSDGAGDFTLFDVPGAPGRRIAVRNDLLTARPGVGAAGSASRAQVRAP